MHPLGPVLAGGRSLRWRPMHLILLTDCAGGSGPWNMTLHSVLRNGRQPIQHHLYYGLITHRGIDHQVEEMPGRPFDSEISLDEVRPLAVHSGGKLNRFRLTFSF